MIQISGEIGFYRLTFNSVNLVRVMFILQHSVLYVF